MSRTVTSVRALQAVAVIAGLAVLFWSLGLPSLKFAQAASLTSISDTLTDSAPSVVSNHTISFTIPDEGTALGNTDTVTITFPSSSFDLSNLRTAEDFDFATGTDDLTVSVGAAGTDIGVATTTNTIVFTLGTNMNIATGTTINVEVGTNATAGGTGVNQIVNPAADSYEIGIATNEGDSGATRVLILLNVTVSASVDTTFTFTVSGVDAAGGATVRGNTITGTSTATAIPFGLLASGTATTTAQDISVETNASQGYVVTAQVDGALQSSTGADIDGFDDGVYSDTPADWSSPTVDVENENTWGHWGITSEDGTTTRSTQFSDALAWIGPTTTPRIVMSHDGPADGTTQGVGQARIGFRVEITSLQEAGDDYEATLTYIATPTF